MIDFWNIELWIKLTNLVFPTLLPLPEWSIMDGFERFVLDWLCCCSLKISEVETDRLDMLALEDDGIPFEFTEHTATSAIR